MRLSACVTLLTLTGCLLCSRQSARAQSFWAETFSDEAAAYVNWQGGGTNTGPSAWTWTTDPAAGYQDPDLPLFSAPSAGDGYFFFNSDQNGQAAHDVTLSGVGAPADCAGRENVHLRFFSQYGYFNPTGTFAQLGVSTDGINFTYKTLFGNLPANEPFTGWVDVDLDEADNQAQVWLRFRWIGNYEYHWKIDDLELYVPCAQTPGVILCDDFDTYDPALKLGPQAGHWTTRSGAEDGDEDGIVSQEQAHTTPNALKMESNLPAGGPENPVLLLGNRDKGRYELRWRMFVPGGKKAFLSLLDSVPAATGADALLLSFAANTGELRQSANGPVLAGFSYPDNQWFDIRQILDLDHGLITLFVNGKFIVKRSYERKLGGVSFFGQDEQHLFYLDDVAFVALPAVAENPDSCEAAIDLSKYFGHEPEVPQTTGLFDNSGATASPTDPPVSCWNETGNNGLDILNNTMWFTFTGDGGKYDIQTVPCNASNYIGSAQGDKGDTQMLVFAGDNCSDLTPVQCNDDLFDNGQPDWRAGVTIETEPGQNYYMLIDGFELQGVVASGEFCIEITRKPLTPCADGKVGAFELANDGLLCAKQNLLDILTVDAASFVLPNSGDQHGLAWCFSQEPVPTGSWPGKIPDIASTPFVPGVSLPFLLNNDTTLAFGTWYMTPVVLGGGKLLNQGTQPYIFNIDPADGCYFVGESKKLVLLPPLDKLAASYQATDETLPPGNNGAIALSVGGGSGQYLNDASLYGFKWTDGRTTKDISGLSAGMYTVTISDLSGCEAPLVLSIAVGQTVHAAPDPPIVQAFDLSPNPTAGTAIVHLTLQRPAALRIELLNLQGQVLQSHRIAPARRHELPIDLRHCAAGMYVLRVEADGQVALRQVAVQR